MRRSFLAVLFAACACAPAVAQDRACFSPDFVRDFEVVSPREVHVTTGGRDYAVILRRSCPQLDRADRIAFSSEPSAWRHLGTRAWHDPRLGDAAIVAPVNRVCGRGEWLVPAGFSVHRPASGCAIEQVIRLR